MKIASSVEYAARLMVRLARSYGQAAVPGEKLSESEGVPIDYVNQLLLRLRRAGLVISHRGAGGGYVLAQPPPQVNLGHIFRAVEGQVFEGVCGSMIKVRTAIIRAAAASPRSGASWARWSRVILRT